MAFTYELLWLSFLASDQLWTPKQTLLLVNELNTDFSSLIPDVVHQRRADGRYSKSLSSCFGLYLPIVALMFLQKHSEANIFTTLGLLCMVICLFSGLINREILPGLSSQGYPVSLPRDSVKQNAFLILFLRFPWFQSWHCSEYSVFSNTSP